MLVKCLSKCSLFLLFTKNNETMNG
ncbi:hypothetical protein Gotri_012614, partial [Gossypium trilobum]|nr:hypothetical protein [Gossypium trilobum]